MTPAYPATSPSQGTEQLSGLFAALAHQISDAVVITDHAGRAIWNNPAFESLTSYSSHDVVGAQPERLLLGADTDRLATMRLRAAVLSGEAWRGALLHYRKDGTSFWHELSVMAASTSEARYTLWVGKDGSEQRSLARRFLELSGAIELALDGIVILDAAQDIRLANNAFAQLHGYESGAALQGLSWRTFYAAEDAAQLDQRMRNELVVSGEWRGSLTGKRRDGTTFPQEVALSLLSGGVAMVVRDITERKEHEDALTRLSLSDALTGLYNRRAFSLLGQQLLNVAGRQTGHTLLLYFDLNRFKQVNDSLGHHIGDQALMEVADVLRETFRESDLIARLGGDEFVVLAVNSLDPSGDVLMARLDQRLNARNVGSNRLYDLSLARGIARFDVQHPQSLTELLEEADRRMLQAKVASRGA